jgi:hypothetical protein
MQLWNGVNLRRVTPRFPEHAGQEEQTARVKDFIAAADAAIAIMDVEEILCGGG